MKVPLIIRVCNHEQCVDVRGHELTLEGTVVEIKEDEADEVADILFDAIVLAADDLENG